MVNLHKVTAFITLIKSLGPLISFTGWITIQFGTNWGTDFTGETSQIVLEDGGTDGAGTDAGDNIVLDGTDSGRANENSRVELETGGTLRCFRYTNHNQSEKWN